MDKYEYCDGVLSFLRKGRKFRLIFFGDHSLELVEDGNEPIELYKERVPLQEGRFILSQDGDFLERKDVQVQIKEDGLLKVFFKGQAVLDELPYFTARDKEISPDLYNRPNNEPRGRFEIQEGFAFASERPVYGLGDKPGPLDKRGYDFINWNTDNPNPHTDTDLSLYKSIPFFVMFSPENSVGLFVHNTSKTRFDFNKTDPKQVRVDISSGATALYIFLGSISEVVSNYSNFVGTGILPRWALGAQQSRWSYGTRESVMEVVKGYKEADIPLSAIYLDIDYMEQYKDFTIDPYKFPNMPEMVETLKIQGIRLIPIIDAGVKAEDGYRVYENLKEISGFCTENGEIYHNEVWPGDSAFPSFLKAETRDYWAKEVRNFVSVGFAGIWNDMNEPASFKGPLPMDVEMGGKTHDEAHNIYAHMMCEATRDAWLSLDRPFILTRAAYAGTEQYAATWTGDNQSTYDHLRLCIPQLSSLSLSGYSLAGVDIGGFNGDATGELLVRFAVANLLTPIFRNHSACDTKCQEPYAFDDATKRRYRNVVMTRLELLPYIYNCLIDHHEFGSPMLRPLIYNFPEDQELINENTEIMLGDSLLLIPALFAGENKRLAYFPDVFYNYFTHKKFGKGYHIIDCDLDAIPLFVREGSLVPLAPKGTKNTDYQPILRLLWTGKPASLLYKEDSPGDSLAFYSRRVTKYTVDAYGTLTEEILEEGKDNIDYFLGEDEPTISGHETVVLEPCFEEN